MNELAVMFGVVLSCLVASEDIGLIVGPNDPPPLPLVRRSVIMEKIPNAYAVHPEFGRWRDGPGKDFFVGFHVYAADDKRGRLRIFPNRGTSAQPRYDHGFWLDDDVPSARIPSG